jgi:hypothetical protein
LIYDAYLAARRGLGMDEMRYITPLFAEAVRFTVYAEKLAVILAEARSALAMDIPDTLPGTTRMRMLAMRVKLREQVHDIEYELCLRDDERVRAPEPEAVA